MVMQSMFIINLITFINTCAIVYHSFLYKYVSLQTGIILIVVCACMWWLFYYSIIYPSTMQFANRQSYKHSSPIKKDFDYIKQELEEIKDMLK